MTPSTSVCKYEAQLHQRVVNVSFEDLFGWRWFPGTGRCNPSEEWDLGEHPGGKLLRLGSSRFWQLHIALDRVFVCWCACCLMTEQRRDRISEEMFEGRSNIKTDLT